MNKKCLLALVFGLMLSFSVYAQSESKAQSDSDSKGSFFFSVGIYNGFFTNGPITLFSNFEVKKLFSGIVSGNYEFPMGPGNVALGLELGYSSGSRFGGKGGVDFLPIGINAAYVFPLTDFLYAGPRLKIGGLGLLGPDWSKVIPLAGARLEAELRSVNFPLGLFVAGGVNIFPFAPQLAAIPLVEAGIRFPRGKLTLPGFSSAAKNKEPAETNTVVVAPAPVTPAPATPAPVTPAPVVPPPATPTPAAPAPVGPPPATPTPAAPTPVVPPPATPTPAAPAPVVPPPATPTPVAPAPVVPPPATPTPAAPAPVAPVPVAPVPVTPAPAAPAPVAPPPAPVVVAPAIPAPVVPVPAPIAPGIPGRNIILENGTPGILNSIYFEPDTAVLIETYRPVLEMVGRQLAADPSFKLLIRAYAADFGTSEGRYIVSVDRARFSRDYFAEQYGISSSRFSIEAWGSDKTPIYATEDWVSHRCVELILLKD